MPLLPSGTGLGHRLPADACRDGTSVQACATLVATPRRSPAQRIEKNVTKIEDTSAYKSNGVRLCAARGRRIVPCETATMQRRQSACKLLNGNAPKKNSPSPGSSFVQTHCSHNPALGRASLLLLPAVSRVSPVPMSHVTRHAARGCCLNAERAIDGTCGAVQTYK